MVQLQRRDTLAFPASNPYLAHNKLTRTGVRIHTGDPERATTHFASTAHPHKSSTRHGHHRSHNGSTEPEIPQQHRGILLRVTEGAPSSGPGMEPGADHFVAKVEVVARYPPGVLCDERPSAGGWNVGEYRSIIGLSLVSSSCDGTDSLRAAPNPRRARLRYRSCSASRLHPGRPEWHRG